MAINNWRYVVTWGYRDPNGQIVEEVQYVPNATREPDYIMNQIDSLLSWDKSVGQIRAEDGISYSPSSNMFSPAETYALQAQGYANVWDNDMSKVYWDLANSLWKYSQYANSTLWAYDNLLNYMAWNENRLQSVAWKLYNKLSDDISDQRNYVYQMFWPNGELTQEVNKYYDDLGNYLATDAWHQAAKIAAQWIHSGASLWAIRAQQNEAYNQSFARYVQAKEQQINAKQQIASNLINFMSTLRKEYWDTTNQYIIEMYKRANDLYNNVALSVAQDMDSYNKLRFASRGNSTLNDILKAIWLVDSDWNPTNNVEWIIKWKNEWANTKPDTSWLGNWSRSATQNSNKSNVNWTNVLGAMYNPLRFWGDKLWKWLWDLIKWNDWNGS